jgi:chemotaxis family two-component system response regulator Rcp1
MYSRNTRLLLVEDNPADVWLLREALRLAGLPIQLTVARDGVEASQYLHQVESDLSQCPDLVLLDWNLPRRNGREVLADVKRSLILQKIPIVVLSSSSAEEEKRQAYVLQAAGFMTKPDSLQDYVELARGLEKFWSDPLPLGQTA